jgi:hypothetical protein
MPHRVKVTSCVNAPEKYTGLGMCVSVCANLTSGEKQRNKETAGAVVVCRNLSGPHPKKVEETCEKTVSGKRNKGFWVSR